MPRTPAPPAGRPARRSRPLVPPLHELEAFEAAARHASFLRAADELALTASAISHRIASLEGRLGERLFDRLHRAIRTTAAGERYLVQVRGALAALATTAAVPPASAAGLTAPMPLRLRVQAAPGIAATWLAPAIARYPQREPQIEFVLGGRYSLADLKSGAVDLALAYGEDDWGDLQRRALMREDVYPVASPAYIERIGGLPSPKALARATLLRHPELPWRSWFDAAGLPDLAAASGPLFDDALVMLEAAAGGAGVALTVGTVFERARARSALVRPFVLAARGEAYHLVLSEAGRDKPWVRAFAAWLTRRALGEPVFEPD